jgi:hypothetical protein
MASRNKRGRLADLPPVRRLWRPRDDSHPIDAVLWLAESGLGTASHPWVRMRPPVRPRRGAPPARETGVPERCWRRHLVIEASFEVTAAW